MKIGMIGLGKLGGGICRRLIKSGHEVWGYQTNYEKACEQYEAGYISGCVTSLEYLVQAVKSDGLRYTSAGKVPGIFQLAIPTKAVEETIDELLPLLSDGDIIIDHGNSSFKDSWKRSERLTKLGISYIDCGTSGGVSGLDNGYGLVVTGGKYAVDTCRTIFDAISMGYRSSTTKNDHVMYPQDYGWIYRDW